MKKFITMMCCILFLTGMCGIVNSMHGAKGIAFVQETSIPLPDGLTAVEYLESTGTQYIDTGILSQDGVTAYIEVLRATRSANECYLGGFEDTSSRTWLTYSFANTWYIGYGNKQRPTPYDAPSNTVTSIETDLSSGKISWLINGEYAYNITYSNLGFRSLVNIFMFAMSTANGANYYAIGRIYCCKIFYGGELVRDFIPVRKHGIGYMYDNVTGELFGNQGTGEFIIGPDVQ